MSSLMLLSVLIVAGIGAGVMLQNDFRILGNLRGGTEAFYISVSRSRVGQERDCPRDKLSAFSIEPIKVIFGRPICRFVSVFNGDRTHWPLGSLCIQPAWATALKMLIQAQLTKSYDLADAALVLRGNGAEISLRRRCHFHFRSRSRSHHRERDWGKVTKLGLHRRRHNARAGDAGARNASAPRRPS